MTNRADQTKPRSTWRELGVVNLAPLVGLGLAVSVTPISAEPSVKLQPHRAVYDLSLLRSSSGSGMAEMAGRLVYEISGAACEGYTQNMRFVTRATSNDGSEQVNDIRTSSFEESTGERLEFSSTHNIDSQSQVTEGRAARTQPSKATGTPPLKSSKGDGTDNGVKVEIRQPEAKQLSLPATVYFPIQHSLAMLDVARKGGTQFMADLYDGSEKGDKVSATTTFIGKASTGAADTLPANASGLMGSMRAWPISTSYFEKTKTLVNQDAVPSHEMSVRFYENGVSTKLVLDYGDFALKGEIKEIAFLPEATCAGRK